jgi:hypothetical protein
MINISFLTIEEFLLILYILFFGFIITLIPAFRAYIISLNNNIN